MRGKRYKVKAPDDATYDVVARVAKQSAHICLENRKRRTLAIDRANDTTLRQIEKVGGRISEDSAYDMD